MNTALIVISVLSVAFGLYSLAKLQQMKDRQIENANKQIEVMRNEIEVLRDHARQLEQANPLKVHYSTIAHMDNIAGEIGALRTRREQTRRFFDAEEQMINGIVKELMEMRKPNSKKNNT